MSQGKHENDRSTRGISSMAAVLGICCLGSGIVNVMHAHRTPTSTVMEEHLKDFMEGRPPKDVKKLANDEEVVDHSEDEHPLADQQAAPVLSQPKPAESGAAEGSLKHLSCEAYGGPPDEFAQEMVYWKDIPSDEHYVSPFHVKKGQHKRYMTFERKSRFASVY